MSTVQIINTKKESTKLMLWIEKEILDEIDRIKPEEVSRQECIRQILRGALFNGKN